MPTQSQYDRIRKDVQMTADGLPDVEIDDLYTEAESKVFSANTEAVESWVRIKVIRRLVVAAAKEVDYVQGQSAEKLSQRVQNLVKYVLPIFEADFQDAFEADYPIAMWGALRRPRTTLVEYPEDYVETLWRDVSRMTGVT